MSVSGAFITLTTLCPIKEGQEDQNGRKHRPRRFRDKGSMLDNFFDKEGNLQDCAIIQPQTKCTEDALR